MSTDLEILRQGLRRREAEQQQALTGRRERAWHLSRQAACLLRDEFGASRVVLYGSLVRPVGPELRPGHLEGREAAKREAGPMDAELAGALRERGRPGLLADPGG